MILLVGCSGEKEKQEMSEFEMSDSNMVEEEDVKLVSGEILFSTEYDVEDYCSGCFIVSKNNSLLYGVLDMKGNEIIPVKYDNISFLNRDNILSGINDELLIQTSYEGMNSIYNVEGEEVLTTSYVVDVIKYKSVDIVNSMQACFKINYENERLLKIYDDRAECIAEISYDELGCNEFESLALYPNSPNCYIMYAHTWKSEKTGSNSVHVTLAEKNIFVLNSNFEIKESYYNVELAASDTYYFRGINYFYILDTDNIYKKIGANNNAEIESIEEFSDYEKFKESVGSHIMNEITADNENIVLGNNTLYKSNNTWKLTNGAGNPIYDDRYYGCFREDDTYLLVNEDNEICVIDNKGNMVINYGVLTCENNGTRYYLYYNGIDFSSDDYISGDDGVVIIEREEDMNNVHFYFNEEYRNTLIENRK